MSITNNDAFVSIAAMNDTIDYNHDNDATYDHKEDDDLVIDGLISTSRMKLLEAQLLDQTLADHNDLEDDQDIFLLMQLVEKNDNARGHDITIKDMDETLRKLEEWNRIKSNYLDAIENDQRVKEINKSSASTEIRPETNDAIDSVTTNQDYYEIPDVKLSSVRLEQLERKIESLEDLIKSNAANESKNLEYMNNCEFVTSNKKLSGIEAELEKIRIGSMEDRIREETYEASKKLQDEIFKDSIDVESRIRTLEWALQEFDDNLEAVLRLDDRLKLSPR